MPSISPPRAALRLALAFFVFFLLSGGGHVYSPDGVVMGRVTESLVERGNLSVPAQGYPPGFLAPGRHGLFFGKYGVGLSMVAVPFYLVGRGLGDLAPQSSRDIFRGPSFIWYDLRDAATCWRFFGLSLTNAAVTAATLALLYLLALEVGYTRRVALAVVLVAGFASPVWVYAKTFFCEPLGGLGLTAFALFAQRWQRRKSFGDALLSGGGLGAAFLARVSHGILFPLAALVVVWLVAHEPLPGRRRLAHLAAFAVGPLAAMALVGGCNWVRFGSLWATGYGAELGKWTTPLAVGLPGLLTSPGRGLLPYFPPVLLAFVGTAVAARRFPLWTLFVWGALLSFLGLYSRWYGWDGGWCWGPRFLVPLLPLLTLQLAPFLAGEALRRRSWRLLGWGLILLSAAINAVGTLVPFTEYHQLLRRVVGRGYLPLARWSWQVWPPYFYLRLPKTYYLETAAARTTAGWWLIMLAAGGAVLLLPLARGAVRAALGHPPGLSARGRWAWGAGSVLVAFAAGWWTLLGGS